MDRLSNLPCVIVQEILSFLSLEDIARTSLVSKRFKYLCSCMPDLYIRPVNSSNQQHLCDWIDKFLILRNGAKIQRFHILLWIEDFRFHLKRWIHSAVLCNVEEFDLSFHKKISLPLCIFACASLKVLKLNLEFGVLKLLSASSYSFNSLQVLSITRVKFTEELSEDWISSLFPSLKKLNLGYFEGVMKHLKITSSSLECLSITCSEFVGISVVTERLRKLYVRWYKVLPVVRNNRVSSYLRLSFRLYAPNLEEFTWRGQLYANYCFQGSFMCIDDTTNYIVVPTDSKCYLFQLLRFVTQARSLKLVGWVLELQVKLFQWT
ncbi:F-box/FBD/LRR-repeat protein At5g56420-like isoform X2 [Cornus florida]|uniref:F-box/FBD/LRR-repeat protein At5g56420-like isoform X2 n=1 Tax=Cornus florida TaxID=4283 RepID=UPI0028990F0E|nr:F-box/FBD/LRR-repeat protein At5g56420-like isoform X2 [Cornus florida]